MTGQALIFLDVDGPLIPFGGPPQHYPVHKTNTSPAGRNPLLNRINPGHGPRLAALPGQLVWATTWQADANECIAPHIGLPLLPVVTWPDPSDTDEQDERQGLHWKTRTLVNWAAGRPFVWIDDEITRPDQNWVSTHHEGPALLHRVDAQQGLTEADYKTIHKWLRPE